MDKIKTLNKKRAKRRKLVVEMQYIKTVKDNIKSELYLLKKLVELESIDSSNFVYGGDYREEVEKFFYKVCNYNNVFPLYNKNVNQQLSGGDIIYKGISIDFKANGIDKDRACFELHKDENGRYYVCAGNDTLIFGSYMKKYDDMILVPKGFIEMIANKEVGTLPIPANFFMGNRCMMGKNKYSDDITNLYIPYDDLKELVRHYLAYYLTNQTVKYLLANGFSVSVDMNEYRKYTKED